VLVCYGAISVYYLAVLNAPRQRPGESSPDARDPTREVFREIRHPSRVRHRHREVCVREHVPYALDPRGDPHRRLLGLPSLLHRQAAPGRYRWSRGALPPEVREAALRHFAQLRLLTPATS